MSTENPLKEIEDRRLKGEYRLHVVLRKARYVEQSHFDLYLVDKWRNRSKDPVFTGIYSQGRRWIEGWIDSNYYEEAIFSEGKRMDLSEQGIDGMLFKLLGDLIPPGGSFMVAYEMFSREGEVHRRTVRALGMGVPPVVTSLGYLLLQAGCWASFKDWYIAEGGREGPRKLQGFKALNKEHARRMAIKRIRELKSFLYRKMKANQELEITFMERAREVIRVLGNIVYETRPLSTSQDARGHIPRKRSGGGE